ncbi:hypothetical protein GLYMA_01G114050v4 [Glycine max]|nr:hypothetical protein GLYMA_01G114050v4 [Glycine max]KAH1162655.1 hypothetical protein GYH30_001235 [Glycine max]
MDLSLSETQDPRCSGIDHSFLLTNRPSLTLSCSMVLQVVKKTKSLKRISFLAHSLRGLFARYAIVVLYSPDTYSRDQPGDLANNMIENSQGTSLSRGGMIVGLELINFITLATPHLGVRGKKHIYYEQLFFCRIY